MKTYQVTAHYESGNAMTFSKYKHPKKALQQIEMFSKNRLIKKVTLLTQEYGEYEKAGEYTEKEEVVYEKNLAAQALGKLSAKARDTSSEAMRELVNKRWEKKKLLGF